VGWDIGISSLQRCNVHMCSVSALLFCLIQLFCNFLLALGTTLKLLSTTGSTTFAHMYQQATFQQVSLGDISMIML